MNGIATPMGSPGSVATSIERQTSDDDGFWSGSHPEQGSDEGALSIHVTALDLPDLSFPHHSQPRFVVRFGGCRTQALARSDV
jgi:hypothetical protein